jgi:hypothetical protein
MTFDRLVTQQVGTLTSYPAFVDIIPLIPAGFTHPGFKQSQFSWTQWKQDKKRPYKLSSIYHLYDKGNPKVYRLSAPTPREKELMKEAERAEKDVTIFEKMSLAATAQHSWSDNSVSVTVSFDPEKESEHVGTVLHMYDGQLKTVSFLPSGNFTYPQMPYTQITEEEYEEAIMKLFPIDFSGVYAGLASDAIGDAYCTTDACEIKLIVENQKDK